MKEYKINQFGIKQIVTAYLLPWQNGYVERIIGSIKRECLDHVIVLNENHLRTIMTDYVSYYNKYRTHLGLNKDSPEERPVESKGTIDKIPLVNGHLWCMGRVKDVVPLSSQCPIDLPQQILKFYFIYNYILQPNRVQFPKNHSSVGSKEILWQRLKKKKI